MDDELYLARSRFTLGAYQLLVESSLPDASNPDYTHILLYKARALIALNNTAAVATLIPADSGNVALKAAAALARYVGADEEDTEEALEQLRDLCVEIEEGADTEEDKGLVRVLAGTAFIRAGETEEALETLGAGTPHHNLEATALIVHVHLSIHRPDLARKEFERAKTWAEDDLLLQLIEASIELVAGRDEYSTPLQFYGEQVSNPALGAAGAAHVLAARAVTRVMRGEISEARSDLEEAQTRGADADTLNALVVAAGLGAKKLDVSEWWSRLSSEQPQHPLLADVEAKASLFDQFAASYEVPPSAA